MARGEEALADRMDWWIAQPQWTRELEQAARRGSGRQTWDDANPDVGLETQTGVLRAFSTRGVWVELGVDDVGGERKNSDAPQKRY